MSDVLTELTGNGVLLITLNRPDRLNALGGTLLPEFHDAMLDASSNPTVRVIAITGAGRGFCAGADLGESEARSRRQAERPPSHLDRVNGVNSLHTNLAGAVYDCPKPTVALVNGPAAGAGFGMSLAADFRIAAQEALFVSAFARIGLSGDSGISYGLYRQVGRAQALEILMLSPRIGANEALELGLVRQVVAGPELLSTGLEFCEQLAAGPVSVFSVMKRNLALAELASYKDALHAEADGIAISGGGGESAQAMAAFLEKRTPTFS